MKVKLKAIVSQPCDGKSGREVVATHKEAIAYLKKNGYKVVDNLPTVKMFTEMAESEVLDTSLYLLAKCLENMSRCNAVYFCKGWESDRTCKIEHEVAKAFGRYIIYEK